MFANIRTYGLGYYGQTCCGGNGTSNCEYDSDLLNRCSRSAGHGLTGYLTRINAQKVEYALISPQMRLTMMNTKMNAQPTPQYNQPKPLLDGVL